MTKQVFGKVAGGLMMALSLISVGGCGGGATPGGATPAGKGGLVGNPGPDFSLDSVNGQGKVSLSGNKGKVVIVDFWATWCEPCKKSFPKLQELNVKYKGSLVIIGISEDDEKGQIADFGNTHGAKFPLVWDEKKAQADKWKPANMPTTFIVDKQGVVKFVHQGYHDGEEAEIDKEIKSLL
ncbi:MAG: TlpA disulfide reductase family protein [Polyangiaceae bacterium]